MNPSAQALARQLKERAIKGIGVAVGVAGLSRLLFFLQQLLLARLLPAEAFGQYAFAMMVAGLPALLVNLRGAEAVIQSEDDDGRFHDLVDTAFTLQLILAFIMALLLIAGRGLLAALLDKPYLAPLLAAMSLLLFTSTGGPSANTGPLMLPAALLERRLEFVPARLPELANVSVNLAVSLALALLGQGVWSLVWGFVAGSFFQALLLWRLAHFQPRLRVSRPVLRRYLGFSWPLYLSYILSWGYLNADYFFVGRWKGEARLGIYYMAFTISQLPLQARFILSRVALPAFARARQEPALLQRTYALTTRYALAAAGLAAGVGIGLAEPAVRLLLGERWLAAAPVLQILLLSTFFRLGFGFNGELLISLGRTDAFLGATAAALGTLLALGPAFLRLWDIPGMAWAVTASSLASAAVSCIIIARELKIAYAGLIAPALVCTLLTVPIGLLTAPHIQGIMGLISAGAGLVVLYCAAFLALFERRTTRRLWAYLGRSHRNAP
ncbi:MAG: oligosaccharide flippase family protein [Anaerolineae bacterium]|nr:oligosaccharide flippase family protein [Anaerolineae bacterium]